MVSGWRFLIFSGEFGVLMRITQDRAQPQGMPTAPWASVKACRISALNPSLLV